MLRARGNQQAYRDLTQALFGLQGIVELIIPLIQHHGVQYDHIGLFDACLRKSFGGGCCGQNDCFGQRLTQDCFQVV